MFATNFFDVVMPERLFVYVIYALMAWVLPEKYKKDFLEYLFFAGLFIVFCQRFFGAVCGSIYHKILSQGFLAGI